MDGHVEIVGHVVDRRPAVGAAPGRTIPADGEEDALRAGFEWNLSAPSDRVLPECDYGRRFPPVRSTSLRHSEGSQRQDGRTRIIGQYAGILRGSSRGALRSVQQVGDNGGRADRANDLGHLVDLGEILADE